MLLVMEQVLNLLIFVTIGYVLSKTGKANSEHTKLLSTLHVYVFLPCSIINTYANNFTVAYIRDKYPLLLSSFVIMGVMIVVSNRIAKLLTRQKYLQDVYSYSLAVSNYGGFGFPLVGGLFDGVMLQNAMIFALPISMYTSTLGYAMLTKTKLSLKKIINPVIVASIVGAIIGLTGIKLPYAPDSVVTMCAACMAPVGMMLVGMVVSEFDFASLMKGKANYIVAVLRLLVIPCTIAGLLKLLGLDDIVIPALMMHAMPCGMNTIIFPRLVGEDCRPGAAITVITSLMACVTIPLCVMFFT
jgi:predicted permease